LFTGWLPDDTFPANLLHVFDPALEPPFSPHEIATGVQDTVTPAWIYGGTVDNCGRPSTVGPPSRQLDSIEQKVNAGDATNALASQNRYAFPRQALDILVEDQEHVLVFLHLRRRASTPSPPGETCVMFLQYGSEIDHYLNQVYLGNRNRNSVELIEVQNEEYEVLQLLLSALWR
jgi:hypothetical protein